MCDSGISAKEVDTFVKRLGGVVRRMDSLENLESWISSQPRVVDVSASDYLIKTEPPRKELFVTFKMVDGSTVTKVVDVILYPDQSFGLAGVHEP